MDTLLAIFIRVILPVFVMIAVGYVAARFLPFDLKTLSRFGLYVLVPCLVFTAMARTTITAVEFGQILGFYFITTIILTIVSAIAARAMKLDNVATSSFQLSILFTNCVNIGFPVLLLAYGQSAVDRALVYMIAMQIVLQTYGVYIAASGQAGIRDALKRVAQMPGMYAMALGIVVNTFAIPVPATIFEPLKLIGDSLVPFLLIVLGVQLASVSVRGNLRVASVATILRLVFAGVISILVADAMGLQSVTQQTMILENSMPTAIFGVALAQEFDTAVDLITTVIFISTLASMFTLTLWLAVI